MYAILSDIHGNLFALQEVVKDFEQYDIEGIFILGDLIDYGMQSNEVVEFVREHLAGRIICNLWGNHEKAVLEGDYRCFSTQRGKESARFTASVLTDSSKEYLDRCLNHDGMEVLDLEGKRVLAVHGSLEDHYWRSVFPDQHGGDYKEFDIVLSGHSHYSHMFTVFYEADSPEYRNHHSGDSSLSF